MYGGYCAAKIYSESARPGRTPLRVLVLEAGPFVVPEQSRHPRSRALQPVPPGHRHLRPEAADPRPGLGGRLAQQHGLPRDRLLRRRQVAVLGRLVSAPAGCRPDPVARGSPRLPEQPSYVGRSLPNRLAPAESIDLSGGRIRDRRPSSRRLRVRSGARAGGAAGPHRPQRRARRTPEGRARRPGRAAARRSATPSRRRSRCRPSPSSRASSRQTSSAASRC